VYLSKLRRGAVVASLVVAWCLAAPVAASAASVPTHLTAAERAALAYANHPGGELVRRHANADGTTTETTYLLGSGTTPAREYAQLTAEGVTDLVDPSKAAAASTSGVVPADPGQCFHGTAFALPGGVCPPYRWTNTRGLTLPEVWFYDLTGPSWPVDAAVATWNSSSSINVMYTPNGCPSGRHCVKVIEAIDSAHPDICGSTTSQNVDSNRHFLDGKVNITFNDYAFNHPPGTCFGSKRAAACHEIGHALGMSHNSSATTSCMYGTSNSNMSQVPNTDDYWVLAHISYVSVVF